MLVFVKDSRQNYSDPETADGEPIWLQGLLLRRMVLKESFRPTSVDTPEFFLIGKRMSHPKPHLNFPKDSYSK
jgi:hypothetical protein